MMRCLQCCKTQGGQHQAAYATVLYRPVISAPCAHGPFCQRCRRSITSQVLPCCLCRALIDSWNETSWPAKVQPVVDQGMVISSARGDDDIKCTVAVVVSNKGANMNPPAAQFVSWDNFEVGSKTSTSSSHTPGHVGAAAAGPVGPPLPRIGVTTADSYSGKTPSIDVTMGLPTDQRSLQIGCIVSEAKNAENDSDVMVTGPVVASQVFPRLKRSRIEADEGQPIARPRVGLDEPNVMHVSGSSLPPTVASFAAQAGYLATRRHRK